MPARKPIPSLQDLCKHYITSQMDIWCGKSRIITTTEIVDNPISRLPNPILNDICTMLMQNENPDVRHLNTLINNGTNQLDASRHTLDFTKRLIEVTSSICTNLTSINLSKSRVDPNCLIELTKANPSITYINLESTATFDHVLFHIGNNCPKFLELDVRNTNVRDVGIKALCLPNQKLFGHVSRGRCRLIEKLFVTKKIVTDKGAATAILNLPNLRIFEYENVLKVIENIYVKESNLTRKFKLESVDSTWNRDVNITDFTIQAVVNLCPNVSRIRVDHLKRTDRWLSELANFSRLQDLTVSNVVCFDSITFFDHIAPILKIIGNNLKSLHLAKIIGINLWDVGICCSRLTRLFLRSNERYSPTVPKNIPINLFVELREVIITCAQVPSDQLEVLLCNCIHVQVLKFQRCPALHDGMLRRVFDCNSFSDLHTFAVVGCNDINVTTVLWMLGNWESLKNLAISNCVQIWKLVLIQLQQHIQRSNLDVTLIYCECEVSYFCTCLDNKIIF